MCGISGIITDYKVEVNKSDLKSMNDLIEHRGPDGEGYFYYKNIGLGHRRLSILDLSNRGVQPMQYDEDYAITYNGEVYNYLEIRKELIQKGYIFLSGTDTEVILASYKEWGENCVNRFNGMWSFAIIDKKRDIVFMSRDRFGIKPFYYFRNGSIFYFGSEIKQLLPFIHSKKVNRQILFDYLYLGYHHHTNETFFEEIYSLDPGHNITYNLVNSTYKVNQYYSLELNEEYEKMSFEKSEILFEKTIDKAISLRLRSDVRVGTCLSGGLDSSYIASVAAKEYNVKADKRFTAITAKSSEKKTDESNFAKIVVDECGLNWKITEPSTEDFVKTANEVIRVQEEPFGSPSIIMQYFVMEKAKKEGCTVMLDGQGGDEALLGYERYYVAYLNQQKGVLNKIKKCIDIVRNSKLTVKDLILYNTYFRYTLVRAYRQKKRYHYVKREFKSFLNMKLLDEISGKSGNTRQMQKNEISKMQLQKLLKYEDRNSMRHSIETRVPFVDYNVVELGYSLPFSYKMNGGWSKYILRRVASTKLPKEIIWRRNKFGFEAPTNIWLSDKRLILDKIVESKFMNSFINIDDIPKNIDNISLWKLYNIAVWAETFKVKF